jgi:hypothetical protein
MPGKDDRITIRFDRVLGRKIRALAQRRGLSVAEYCRLMCCLEVLNDDPDQPYTLVQQQLKETLSEVEAFAQQDPQDQAVTLHRNLEAIAKLREATKKVNEAADQALTWLYAIGRASDAYTRQHTGAKRPKDKP